MADVVERVMLLIAKGGSTHSEEEARTCAATACRIIREKKLVVITREQAAEFAALALADERGAAARSPAPAPKPPASRPRRPPVDKNDDLIIMRSRYEGHCRKCGVTIKVGDELVWNPRTKAVWCLRCGDWR